MHLMHHTHTQTQTHKTPLTWKVYICLSEIFHYSQSGIALWHCSACSTVHRSSDLHLTSRIMSYEEGKKKAYLVNEMSASVLRENVVVSLDHVFSSLLVCFSAVSCPLPCQRQPAESSVPSSHSHPLLHRTQNLLHTCLGNLPRGPAVTCCGKGLMMAWHHILKTWFS